MAKIPDKDKLKDDERTDGSGKKPGERGLSRRQFFMGSAAAAGSAVLAGASGSYAMKEFSGWPGRYGCLTDLTMCVGCRSCEKACNAANKLARPEAPFDSPSVFNGTRRPTKNAYTVVNRYEPKSGGKPVYRKIQCNHCNEPACASACPIHAYTKTKEGPVLYNPDLCFGCRYCMVACPFYVPAYDYDSALEPKIIKCTMCHGRISKGGIPACVEACPAGALTFGKRDDLIKLARKRIEKSPDKYIDHIYGETEAGGTSWLYLSAVPFGEVGLPEDLPKAPMLEQTKGFLAAVPLVFTIWPALFGMFYAALKHRTGPGDDHGGQR
ncbi:MAG: 4Fe-4S dicluster domain-containing protein [Nitrospiraceae bacterium]|nr:4Fe-4S dicluster domain-containing protein [Nitrospiraceae bacterium]